MSNQLKQRKAALARRIPSWVFVAASLLGYIVVTIIALRTTLLGHISWDSDGTSDWLFLVLIVLAGFGIGYAIMRDVKGRWTKYIGILVFCVVLAWPAFIFGMVVVLGPGMLFNTIF
jgi:hypothetical protein